MILNSADNPYYEYYDDIFLESILNFNSVNLSYTTFGVPIPIDQTLELLGVSIIITATTNTVQFPGVVLDPDEVEIDVTGPGVLAIARLRVQKYCTTNTIRRQFLMVLQVER